MGLPLLLGLLLLCRTGGLFATALEQPSTCVTAESKCLADPACRATYQTLQNCSQSLAKSSFDLLGKEDGDKCVEAETNIRNSPFQDCKCYKHTQQEEKRCRHIYWTVHSPLTQDYINLDMSPYEDAANEEPLKTTCSKPSTLVSDSRLPGDSTNQCLQVTHLCSMDRKCTHWRTVYASICSGHFCEQHNCHRELRHFFGKVPADLTKKLLFCPCQDELCGERRRNTIVPECSFQSSTKPNCLLLLASCEKNKMCKSRLTNFQEQCKPSASLSDGCCQHNRTACLKAYMGMIGTHMTPNYVSNSSDEVALWCSCENSGNEKDDCDQILSSFASNRCLRSAIQSQMSLNEVTTEDQEKLQAIPSLNIQGVGTSTILTSHIYSEGMKTMLSGKPSSNQASVYSGVQLSSLTLILTFLLLLLGPP